MAFTLDKVVPWGRTFDEYVAMFALSQHDLEKSFLGCSDGPANFNSVLSNRGGRVISADPLYRFSHDDIRKKISETYDKIMEQIRDNKDEFVWERISSVEDLGNIRMNAMNEFLSDYPEGVNEGRYVEATLPSLPFEDREFDIALCSHYLFLYSEQLSEEFHLQSVRELCRVALETRIFPLLELGSNKSRHIERVIYALRKIDFKVSIEKVSYEFQKGGNEMLKIIAHNN